MIILFGRRWAAVRARSPNARENPMRIKVSPMTTESVSRGSPLAGPGPTESRRTKTQMKQQSATDGSGTRVIYYFLSPSPSLAAPAG